MRKLLAFAIAYGLSTQLIAQDATVVYPQKYKEYKHIKTMIIKAEHPMADIFEGIHHIYANDKAYEGYKSGKFIDGSIIVLDYLKYEDKNHTIYETSRNYVAVMHKDEKRYKETKGWGYEAFKGDTKEKLVTNIYSMCVNCHMSQEKNNYVFSKIRK